MFGCPATRAQQTGARWCLSRGNSAALVARHQVTAQPLLYLNQVARMIVMPSLWE